MKSQKTGILILLIVALVASALITLKFFLPPKQPNVLFILADDFGYSDVGFMGSDYYETPHLDQLSSESVIFTSGYAGAQVCSPSRATILTGQFTARHGITDWIGAKTGEAWRERNRYTKVLPPSYNESIAKTEITLPQAFKMAGYHTFFAGKWHLGGEGHSPEDYGFDINKGGWESGSPKGGFFAPFNNPKLEDHKNGENLSMRLAKETAAFIKSSKDEPFFAYLSFYAVHAPIQTTRAKWSKFRDKAEKRGIADQGFAQGDLLPYRLHQDNPVYAGLVESMDDAIGFVLEALKENGLDKNTIVVFTSDNGGVVSGDHYATSCAPLKGGKGHQWEGGIRVPFTIKVPWMKHRGQQNDTPVIGSDLYPTLLDLAGSPIPSEAHVDGKSLRPLLKGKRLPLRPLYWHYPHYGNQGGRPVSIVRQGYWKLIYFHETKETELYNLETDLHEDHNLKEQHLTLASTLEQQLLNWLTEVGAKFPTPDPLYDASQEAVLIEAMKTKQLERMETWRQEMLSVDYQPNENWWGSEYRTDD